MRVAFFGLPLGALLLLSDRIDVRFAVLSPVDAPGRRRLTERLRDEVIDARCTDGRALEAAIDAAFERHRPELVVSWFFTRKIPNRWIAPPLVAIGAHPSLLPRHRGPDPFYWAIDSGDPVSGVTIHRLVDAYDEGEIFLQESLEIGGRNAWQLARALDRVSLRLLRRVVTAFAQGALPVSVPQDEARATWAGSPSGEQLRVDFRWSTERVLRRIRALSPIPGLAIEIRGVRLFVTRASPAAAVPKALNPGEASIGMDSVVIRTADGAVRLDRAVLCDGPEAEREIDGRELSMFLECRSH